MSINKSIKVRTPCNCGSGLYNISRIPENQCFDCYKGSTMKVPCKCGSGLYNISGIPENQFYDCYKGPKCKCGIFYVFCTPCLKNNK